MFNVTMKKNLSWPQFCEVAMGNEELPKMLCFDDKNNCDDDYRRVQGKEVECINCT